MNTTNKIELDFCTVTLREDGLIENRFDWDNPYEVDAKDLNEIANAMTLLSSGKKKGIISIAGLYGSITPEARKVDIGRSDDYTLALALVIQSLSQRILSNFYFKIKKTEYPIKSFKTEWEAEGWLYQQIRLSQEAV